MTQQEKEFNKLKDFMDIIITTARLSGYGVKSQSSTNYYNVYIENPKSTAIELSLSNQKVLLSVRDNQSSTFLFAPPFERKINHLKKLLEAL